MLIAFLNRVWPVLEILSIALGIASGVMLFLPLLPWRIKHGKREKPNGGQKKSQRNVAIAFVISIVVFSIGVAHEKTFVTTTEPSEFSVSASYQAIRNPLTTENVTICAYTSGEADYVTVVAVPLSNSVPTETFYMRSYDKQNWKFPAEFYIKGTYKVTVCAYDRNGNMCSDMFTVTYPFT